MIDYRIQKGIVLDNGGHSIQMMEQFEGVKAFGIYSGEDLGRRDFTGAHELLTKYMHNVFGAYKVTYFNACSEYCEQMEADWRKVQTGVLLSGYINDTHTYVPGPDGKLGCGGKCFPKAVKTQSTLLQDD